MVVVDPEPAVGQLRFRKIEKKLRNYSRGAYIQYVVQQYEEGIDDTPGISENMPRNLGLLLVKKKTTENQKKQKTAPNLRREGLTTPRTSEHYITLRT